MDRRQFLHSAKIIAASAGASGALATAGLAAERHPEGAPVMRRFDDQRWALDNIIQANGIDWDQGRTGGLIRACGAAVVGDMATLRQRVKKFADIAPAFESLARRREAMAKAAEEDGETFEARDNYYIAAQYWASGMWPIDEVNDRIKRYNDKKRETFSKFMQLADHKVEWAEIPYRGKNLPCVFHLPPGYQAGQKVPVIVMVPGMDGTRRNTCRSTATPGCSAALPSSPSRDPAIGSAVARHLCGCVGLGGNRQGGHEVAHGAAGSRCRQGRRRRLELRLVLLGDHDVG